MVEKVCWQDHGDIWIFLPPSLTKHSQNMEGCSKRSSSFYSLLNIICKSLLKQPPLANLHHIKLLHVGYSLLPRHNRSNFKISLFLGSSWKLSQKHPEIPNTMSWNKIHRHEKGAQESLVVPAIVHHPPEGREGRQCTLKSRQASGNTPGWQPNKWAFTPHVSLKYKELIKLTLQ